MKRQGTWKIWAFVFVIFGFIVAATVEINNSPVLNITGKGTKELIVVDAGHGGADPGATANGLKEKDLNLKAAQYMYQRLKELGIPATIVRDADETVDRDERVRRILEAYGNDPNVIVISNHINAGGGDSHCVTKYV